MEDFKSQVERYTARYRRQKVKKATLTTPSQNCRRKVNCLGPRT
jgi:hypothetical protein